jgi:N-acetylglucosamine-6-phosphate deacetylase
MRSSSPHEHNNSDDMRLGVSAAVIGDEVVAGDVEIAEGRVSETGIPGAEGSLLAVPGFVDVHVHGHAGTDFVEATLDDHAQIARALPATGVTAYQPTIMSLPLEDMIAAISRHPGSVEGGARTLGFHLEGPFLSSSQPGAHKPTALVDPTLDRCKGLLEAGHIDQITMAPELDGALDAIEYFVAGGVVVSLGHSVASAAVTATAISRGAAAFTHVFNAMKPFSHRDPGILEAALSSDTAFLTGIFDGVHLSDEAAKVLIRCAGERLVAITDGTSAINAPGDRATLGNTEVDVSGGAPRLPDGTIAGSILTMDAAFRLLLRLGLDLPAAVRATATAPAALAAHGDIGGITTGGRGDVVVLDDRYEVIRTFVDGIEVFHS